MKIVCPSCKKPIPGADIDISGGRALCRPCGEVVPIGDGNAAVAATALSDALAILDATPPTALARFRPADFRMTESHTDKRWQFKLSPNRLAAVPLAGFAAVWNTFLFFWYWIALKGGAGGFGLNSLMLVVPLLHVAAGIFISYKAAVGLLNTTRIELSESEFKVLQGPIPGKKMIESAGAVLRFEPSRNTRSLNNNRGTMTRWQINLLTDDERAISLPLDLASEEHAAYLAHRLNHAVDENRAPATYRG